MRIELATRGATGGANGGAGDGANALAAHFHARADEKMLFAGLRAGIALPFECATGTCGSCRARLECGRVEYGWADAPGRAKCRRGRDEFLMCQASALQDCRVRPAAKIARFREDDLRPRHYRGQLAAGARLTDDVLTFEVALPSPTRFHAGQFFVLRAPRVDGYRAYSMVNYEAGSARLQFVIKRKTGGAFSEWLFAGATDAGASEVELFGPLGRATFHADEDCDLFLVAGGSGIAGLMSILQHAAALEYLREHTAALFFGVRKWEEAFFLPQLRAMQERFARLKIYIVASDADAGAAPAELQPLAAMHGLVHERAAEALPADATNTMVYVAGPPPMVDASLRALLLKQVAPARIRYDKFS